MLRTVPPLRRLIAQRDMWRAQAEAAVGRVARLGARVDELEERNLELLRSRSALVPAEDRLPPLRYLFMLTYGRSGSTLLQGIVNSIPGYLMRGENRDALHHLFRYHHVLESERVEHERTSDTTRSAWYGIDEYAGEAALVEMRRLVVQTVLRPRPDTRVLGFKEIRWWHDDWREYLAFLLRLFPDARFLINVRQHDAVMRSRWWAEREDPRGMLERYERRLTDMAGVLGERAYRLRYDEYVADPDTLRGMFDWLGEEFDRERIDAVMSVRHSY